MIRYVEENEVATPFLYCDICGERVELSDAGTYVNNGDDAGTIVVHHNGCGADEVEHIWDALGYLPIEYESIPLEQLIHMLMYNLGVKVKDYAISTSFFDKAANAASS